MYSFPCENANGLSQQTTEKCPTADTETPFWAPNEVSRAQGKPITNCTFHTLGCRGCEGGEKENPGACHLKLIELSHARKTLIINPPQLNKAFTLAKKFMAVISSWVFQEELALNREIPKEQCRQQ